MDNDISSVHYCVYAEYMTNRLWITASIGLTESQITSKDWKTIYLHLYLFTTITFQLLKVIVAQ